MAKTVLMPGVETISGKVGNYLFKTFNKNGKKEVRVYLCPQDSYQRKTKQSATEKASHKHFGEMAREVSRRQKAGDMRPKKAIWDDVRKELKNS